MVPESVHVAIVLSPFLLLPAAGWLGGRGSRSASFLAVVPAVLTAYFGFIYWLASTSGFRPSSRRLSWVATEVAIASMRSSVSVPRRRMTSLRLT